MRNADQRAAERVTALYEEKAKLWSKSRGRAPTLEQKWLARFEDGLPASAEILDLGTGDGYPIAASVLARGHKIVGVDAAASLIEEATANLPAGEWHVADMRTYQDERTFDGLIAWHSFFHLTPADQRQLLPRFAQFVRPGGKLLFTSGPKAGVAIGEWDGEALFHASLSQSDYVSRLKAAGFDVLFHENCDPESGGAAVWLAQRR